MGRDGVRIHQISVKQTIIFNQNSENKAWFETSLFQSLEAYQTAACEWLNEQSKEKKDNIHFIFRMYMYLGRCLI